MIPSDLEPRRFDRATETEYLAARSPSARTVATVTIQDLGSIGEFVAAVATLATLAYLATQIRQNTLAVRAGSHHAVSDSFITVNSWVARDPGMARIFRVGTANLDDLSEDERIQFGFMLLSVFRIYETTYYQHVVGAAEDPLLRSVEGDMAFVLGTPGGRQWWDETPFGISPEFRSHVEATLLRSEKIAVHRSEEAGAE
jgi:hypothetical protein